MKRIDPPMTRPCSRRRASRAVLSALCLAAVSVLPACSSREEKFAEHLARAESYLAAGQDKEALVELRSALQADPKSAETSWRIAEVLRKQGKMADAVFFYREASRLDPARSDAMLQEAALLYGDDPARAGELIRQVMEKDPGNADAHVRTSELAMLQGRLDDALAAAMTAAQLAPQKGLYQQQLGIVHRARIRDANLRGEKVDDALFQRAIDAFEKADQIDGPYWAYRIEAARVYGAWPGHMEQAKASYRKAVELAIESGDLNADLLTMGEARNYAVGIQDEEFLRWAIETMTRVKPAETSAWLELARMEEAKGADGEAVMRAMLEKNPSAVAAYVAYANWLIGKMRIDEALQLMEKGVAAPDADVPSMLGALANLQFRVGKFEEAHATTEKLRSEHPSHPRTALATAQLAIAEGRMGDAAKVLREDTAAQVNPEAQRMLAFCEMTMRNIPAAIQAVNRAQELTPGFDGSITRLQAQLQHMSGDHGGAIQSFRRLAQNGVTLDAMEELRWVQSLYEAGRADAGKARLERLLEREDSIPEVTLEYAFRESDANPARAMELLEAALVKHPNDPRVLDYLTNLDVRAGRVARALERLNQALSGAQANAAVVVLRGRLLASQKQWAAAEGDLRATFEAAPNYPGVSDLLVLVYEKQGKLDEAISSLERVDASGGLGGSQLYLLGRLHLQRNDLAKARAVYERVLQAEPSNASAQNDLAYVLAQTNQEIDRALELAQAAQKERAEDASVADTLGFIYFKKGLLDPAIQQLRYAIELAGRSPRPDFHYHLGLALAAANRPDEASAAFDAALALDPEFGEAAQAKRDLEKAQAAAGPSANPS